MTVTSPVSGEARGKAYNLYIWVVNPTGETIFKQVDLKSLDTSLTDIVNISRESIGVRGIFVVEEVNPSPNQTKRLQQLHQILIEPIAQYLPSNPQQRVIFIPQNELFLVPFPALIDNSENYLIEKHTILTTPSIQVLQLTREKKEILGNSDRNLIGKDALIVGNPNMPTITNSEGDTIKLTSLIGAEREAIEIAKQLNSKAITGSQATETSIKKEMENARIIHLATHGLLDDFGYEIPGATALTPSTSDDGLLTSGEIFDMNLKASLVVLSACDTGGGNLTGDGAIGLSRSLIAAGVSSVIVFLWSVKDNSTAELMTEFYRLLEENPDKAQALRQVMLTTKLKYPNPKDWAAFTIIGEAE